MYLIGLETLSNEKYYVKFVIYVTNLSKLMDIETKTDFIILLDTRSYRFMTNGMGFAAINYMG